MLNYDFAYPVSYTLQRGADGRAYIVEDERDRTTPCLVRTWWPTSYSAYGLANSYGDLIGSTLTPDRERRFHFEGRPLYVTIADGGRALPALIERIPLMEPRQRGKKQPIHYKNGWWLREKTSGELVQSGLIEAPLPPFGPGPGGDDAAATDA